MLANGKIVCQIDNYSRLPVAFVKIYEHGDIEICKGVCNSQTRKLWVQVLILISVLHFFAFVCKVTLTTN